MIKKLLVGVLASAMLLSLTSPAVLVNAQEMEQLEIPDKINKDASDVYVDGDFEYTIRQDGTAAICAYTGSGSNMVIPSQVNGITVTTIYSEIMPRINFAPNSDVKSITIPATVNKIMEDAFNDCESLTTIIVEEGNTAYKVVDNVLFKMDGSKLLRYPSGSNAYSYIIPYGVTDIAQGAFSCAYNLRSVTIPETVTEISDYAFSGCERIINMTIPSSVKEIGECVFYTCDFTNMTIPSSVEYIGSDTFSECDSLEHIVLSDKMTRIEGYTFSNCDNLKSVTIPVGITGIGESAFSGCNLLTDVYYGGSEAEWNAMVIESGNKTLKNATIHYNRTLEKFVERMYTIALDRESDANGKADWVGQLKSGKADAATLAFGFMRSPEFTNRKLDDETYLKVLYKTFFDREPDEGGMANWMNHLSSGSSREFVLAQFVNSVECMNLCNSYEIERGYMKDDGSVVNIGISKFVGRLYTKVLGRKPEAGGYGDWILRIINSEIAIGDIPAQFFGSQEYIAKDKGRVAYVYDLYATFFDRAPANGEELGWIEAIKAGTAKSDIIPGFANSQEFKNLLVTFGL